MIGEIRWNPEQVLSTRDGIDIASLHLPAADAAVMQLLTALGPVILSTPDQMWPGFGAKFPLK